MRSQVVLVGPEMMTMRRSRELGGHGRAPDRAGPGSGLSRCSAASVWWAPLTLIVPVLGLVAGQAVLLLSRYGASPELAPVDVVVEPSGATLLGTTAVELAAFGDSAMAGVGAAEHHAAAGRPLVRLVDVRGAIGSEFFNAGPMSPDAFHPSAVGYGRIADVLAPEVLAVLGTAQPLGRTDGQQQE